jgi:FixJ family two-component response regulator
VVVWDVAIPYEENCRFVLDRVIPHPEMRSRGLVLTTTNLHGLTAECRDCAHEILGKPFDLQALIDAVEGALGAAKAPAHP